METALEQILISSYKAEMISFMDAHPEYFEEAIELAICLGCQEPCLGCQGPFLDINQPVCYRNCPILQSRRDSRLP